MEQKSKLTYRFKYNFQHIDYVLIIPDLNEDVVPDLDDITLDAVFHNLNIGINLVHKLNKVVIVVTKLKILKFIFWNL